jgi:hypothetical protein
MLLVIFNEHDTLADLSNSRLHFENPLVHARDQLASLAGVEASNNPLHLLHNATD